MGLYTITDLSSGHVEIGRHGGGHGGHGGRGRRGGFRRGRGGGGVFYDGLYDYYEPYYPFRPRLMYEDELPQGVQYVVGRRTPGR